jgi:hypothetical protein
MPEIPVSSPLSYVGVFLLIAGFFLVVAGLNIVKVDKVTVKPGSKTWGFGIVLVVFGAMFLLPEIISSLTQHPSTPTLIPTPTFTPTIPLDTATQEIPRTPESEPVTNTPTVEPTETLTSVDVAVCAKSDFDGSKCRLTRAVFPSDTEAVYVTWQLSGALARRTEFTRRWYKDGRLLLESSAFAGENARWTPSDGYSYYVYLSATEGTGKRLFGSESLPTGSYRIELFVDGSLANTTEFVLQ